MATSERGQVASLYYGLRSKNTVSKPFGKATGSLQRAVIRMNTGEIVVISCTGHGFEISSSLNGDLKVPSLSEYFSQPSKSSTI